MKEVDKFCIFQNRSSLKLHMRVVHGIDKRVENDLPHACLHEGCVEAKARFKTLSNYRDHLASHHQVPNIASETQQIFNTFEGKFSFFLFKMYS